jgi:hypothetical protein
MAIAYTLIASNTVGSGGVSSVTFSSIASTYTDLVVKCSTRSNRAGQTVDLAAITFNGSSTGYSVRNIYGDYTAAYSSSTSSATNILPQGFSSAASATASTFSNNEIYIPNYTSSNYKSVSIDIAQETNSSTANAGYTTLSAGLWSNTAAITSISIASYFDSFSQYSTFYLYGIKNS